ncbi:MAG: fibronectin type III domain-containing protein, partial [Syntrophobacteraceae bacterium]|nr:fibronectin type III domain-containing protein [Syntrophobacteraceae bacterium]
MSMRDLSKWSKRNRLSSTFALTFLTLFSIRFWGGQTLHAAQVTLAWDANSDPVAGYRLYYGHASGNYQSNVDVGSTTTHTWSGLADGQTYHFAATAYDASNNQSDYSEELVCHTITPSSGTGGSVSPSSTVFVTSGGSQTFTISPSAGFRVSNVLVDGQSVGPVTNYSFTGVTTPRAITASFVPDTTYYTITASVTGGGGSISPSGSVSVNSGGSQTFNVNPSTGNRVSDVLV